MGTLIPARGLSNSASPVSNLLSRNNKSPLRSRSIGTKVTEEEYARLERCAGERQRSVSEWCREALLAAADGATGTPAEHAMIGEVLALRAILLNVFFQVAQGEQVTAEQMDELIAQADAGKTAKARARLQVARAAMGEDAAAGGSR